jgi:subtilisin family serine protease
VRGSLLAILIVALACASPAAALTPNEKSFASAWGQKQVNMPRAWDITIGSPRVIIADVDTGVFSSLPDLRGALVPGWDFVENDSTTEDRMGHGTVTATEMVARGNNGYGIAGYCWRCKLMPIRVSRNGLNFNPALTAEGIRWAVDHGARIISLSFNDEGDSPTADPQIAAAIADAAQRNVLVVGSAGNTGTSIVTHPAGDPGAYGVAGTNPFDHLFPWSTSGSWIQLAAPGCQWVDFPWKGGFDQVCGNSTSAPAIAGIAGLMLSVNPTLTPAQLVSALVSTAVPVAGLGGGRVDAYRALLAVGGKLPTRPSPPPAPPPPPAAAKALNRATPLPTGTGMTTRVLRGVLGSHRVITIKVAAGLVGATLRSAKATACTVSLSSNQTVWVSASDTRNVVSVSATVAAGVYKVDLSCTAAQPRPFALALRAIFA